MEFVNMSFRTRKQYGTRRYSAVSDHTYNTIDSTTNSNSQNNSTDSTNRQNQVIKKHTKIDANAMVVDEEAATDWRPEIPFWNVCNTNVRNNGD